MGDSNHHLLRVGRDEHDDVSFHPSENNFAYLLFIMPKLPAVIQLLQFTTAGADLIYPVIQMNPDSDYIMCLVCFSETLTHFFLP